MKPIKFSKKLRFVRVTVANLNSKEMTAVNGGKVADEDEDYYTRPCTVTDCQTQCPSGEPPCLYC